MQAQWYPYAVPGVPVYGARGARFQVPGNPLSGPVFGAILPQIASDSLFMANQIRKLDQIRRVGDHPALQPPPKVPTCGMADLAATGTLASIASGYLFEDSRVKGARRAAPRFAG